MDSFYKFNMEVKSSGVNLSFQEVIANTQDTSLYNVDHFKKQVALLGTEEASTAYLPLEIELLHAQDTILGYPCKKYRILQLDYYTQTPVNNYLWVSEDLPIKNLPLLARIFGYRNTLLKDGSLGGMTLKCESEGTPQSPALVVQAIGIERKDLKESDFELPIMYLSN